MAAEFLTCQLIVQLCIIIDVMLDASFLVNVSSAIIVIVNKNDTNQEPHYEWTSLEKNHIMGSAYIGAMFLESIAGRVSDLYRPGMICALGKLLSSILTVLQPLVFSYGFKVAFVARFILGITMSISLPVKARLLVNWFSPSKRTRSIASVSTFSLGIAGSMQLFALLLHYFSWPVIFYVNGGIGIVWSCIWFYLIHDTPEKHPRITLKEKQEIEQRMMDEVKFTRNTKQTLPLRQILTSVPYLVAVFCRLCLGCLHSFVMLQLTIFLNDVLHFGIRETGLYSSLPFIGHVVWAYITCYLADKLVNSKCISKTNIRKLMECSYLFIVGVIMILLAVPGLNPTIIVILFIISGTVMGSHIAGHLSSIMDLAPNFSGTLIGCSASFSAIGVYLSTLLCGLLVTNSTSFKEWQNVFYVMASMSWAFGVLFALLADANVQYWNDLSEFRKEKEHKKMLQLQEL